MKGMQGIVAMVAQIKRLKDLEASTLDKVRQAADQLGYTLVPHTTIRPAQQAEHDRLPTPAGPRPSTQTKARSHTTIRPAQRAEHDRRAKMRKLTCPHCPRTFALPLHLGRHVSTMHKQQQPLGSGGRK